MSQKMQWGVAGLFLLIAIIIKFITGQDTDKPKKQESEIKETVLEPDQIEKNKIMSEMGKKGAAKSAEVRRAKKAAREAVKDEFSA